ncbi:hypothetical protein [Amycolatopsis magusensis]|uniref:Polyketide cyclase / dehydrase and lipid transport n=1 Tax=Amycolatopsis magusensis TaxID=882444 RepID=A0ABS4PQE2_9PSEU|nr:hypothetical protein [Amycolatopsis magusensis]MBP2181543.1 hypothetical protein [Amycolatopsis magusensis]
MKLMVEVAGEVDAPPEQVLALVVRKTGFRRDGDLAWSQGGWWYRGEYRVTAAPGGSTLVHRVYNVAKSPVWTVALANRLFIGFGERTRAGVGALLAEVGDELGCAARLKRS